MIEDPWELHYKTGAAQWRGSPYTLPKLPSGSRVLDVGCGTGSTLIKAAETGYSVVGVDISSSAIEKTRERLESRGLQAELHIMDLTGQITDLGKFDLICAHYVIGALENEGRKTASENLMDLMKPSGLLSFEDLSTGDVREGNGTMVEERTFRKGNGIIQHFFRPDELKKLFKGLEIIELQTESWSHSSMERHRIRALFRHP